MALTWLRVVAAIEMVTLVLIVLNRLTLELDLVRLLGGPVHGLTYLGAIGLALVVPMRPRGRWFSLIPGPGGLLAVREGEREAARLRAAADGGHEVERPH